MPLPTDDILHLLRQHWGHTAFRPLQEDIIRSVLAGQDTLALLPTGGAKACAFRCRRWRGRAFAWWCRR
ncbi:hypothetical protein [Hymenobacter qilianensis]|uniref:hypothetical protein n=1 Tax=Hymenobacter qilianensis TaxID=1385715 RepID=UPI001CB8A645|nr:hypothetical protein [Hymenobacter qilianensis]